MDRCDFSSIMTILRSYVRENNQLNQSEFLYEVFDDFLSSPEGADFSFDNGLVCRWMSGQAKVSPKLICYYSAKSSQMKLSDTLEHMILPMMFDPAKALSDVYLLFIQDPSISDKKKEQLSSLYLSEDTQTLFLSQIICFGMERTFVKRDTKNQKLLAGGSLSPVVLGYIADTEVPKPCRHFVGRESEIENLHECLENNSKVFLYGIPGIGKSELAKAYARKYKKYYTNILYIEYTGDLHQSVTEMDFTDDMPGISEEKRFQNHNRYLRSLREDTLIIIDNFNVTATQDSFLSVIMKYHCRILFTTRSNLTGYSLFPLTEISDFSDLFELVSAFYPEAAEYKSIVEEIIETVHCHTFAVELAAKLLNNGILSPAQLLRKLQEEKTALESEDDIRIIKDGQSSKATYYRHIHTLFSLYTLSEFQQNLMSNMCFLPSSGLSARIFAKWMHLSNLNEINDLIETGFIQTNTRHTISLHPMIQEIALSDTKPSVNSCHILLDSLQKICLMHGIEVDYYKKLFQIIGNIIELIQKDDMPKYLLFLENSFPYMQKYDYQKGMKALLQELKCLLKSKDIGTDSDRALLLDFQATLETQPEKAMKLEKDALALIKEITEENAHLASNLHSNLGSLYRINGYPDLAMEHMEKGLFLLEQYNLLYTNDSVPQITNYAMFLAEQQAPEKGISVLQKLSKGIKEYNSDCCLDYATVQETLGTIYLMTANLPQAKTHFKRAFKIYEKIWADEPEMIETKYQEIQELYPQVGFFLGQQISTFLMK